MSDNTSSITFKCDKCGKRFQFVNQEYFLEEYPEEDFCEHCANFVKAQNKDL